MLGAADEPRAPCSSQEAVDIVGAIYRAGKPAKAACTTLIAHSALRWRREEGNYRDDITAIVVYLPCLPHMDAPEAASHTIAAEAEMA